MSGEPTLVLAWLVLAHLVADFVLQNDWIAITKSQRGRRGWLGVLVHAGFVAVCLVPVPLAYGAPGLAFLLLVVVTHVGVDRWKVGATRRAEALALAAAHKRRGHRPGADPPGAGLGSAWTPLPGLLYVVDQVVHLAITFVGWAFLLSQTPLAGPFTSAVDDIVRGWDREAVHATTLTLVVLASLLIANTKGAYFFVAALVHPREVVEGSEPVEPTPAPPPPPSSYTVRVGPLVASIEPGRPGAGGTGSSSAAPEGHGGVRAAATATSAASTAAATGGAQPASDAVPREHGSPARIGATIGVLERLLVVTFVLVGMEAAIGFVIAAKTLARFKQLDDRGFAEYYLLGTLASVLVALATALLGAAALDTLG